MGNSITDYAFTVISDGPVPLAASFNTFSYAPVFMAVIAAVAIVAAIMYTVWFYSKSMRYSLYSGMSTSEVVKEFYIHPFRLIEAGHELDHQALYRTAA